MRAIVLSLIATLLCCTAARSSATEGAADRILFVGNSLTYVGNVPAIYAALAVQNGRPADADMIVQGGATLAQRVADGSVERALSARTYTVLVLQERGGDLLCSFGPQTCAQSRQAILHLADVGRRHGASVVLLGTYQPQPAASKRLVEEESKVAADARIVHVEVSETLQRLRTVAPALDWFAADGMHPGKDLALLDAILLHRQIRGALPIVRPLTVEAPIYGASSGLKARLRASDAPPPRADTPRGIRYPARTLETMLGALSAAVP